MTKTAERINSMSLMEIFDFVNESVIKQGKASWRGELGDCAYRGPKGLKCAAGFLLDDADYNEGMEGKGARDMLNEVGFRVGDAVESFADPITRKRDLISRLQAAHDGAARCAEEGEAKFVDSFTQKMEHVKSWLNSLPQSR
jgi:hypothetical protein